MFQAKLSINKKILTLVVVILIIVTLLSFSSWLIYKNYQQKSLKTQLPTIEKKEVTYIINEGNKDTKQYLVEISNNSTVFSLLEELSKKENFRIETTIYPEMGVFVKSIDELDGGTNNKWWQYWINNNLGEVAADKKMVNNGDIVEWKFEVISF